MKNLMRIFTGILVLSLILVSCKKDKDKEDTVKNYFIVDGTKYEVSFGTLENYGTDPGYYEGYNLDLYLITSGIDVDVDGDWTGTGKALYFEMYSTNAAYLTSGEYTYDLVSDIPPTFTFDFSDYCLNWTTGSNTWVYLVSGTVTVAKSGSTYTIDLTGGINQNAKTVTAHFSGPLQYIDSSKKSAKTRH
ncbi:MAG: hypothetical protein NTZ85_02685 [Bacteroidia bacterium]|nr:hypothetical protein [Bacteroidia bacterium]